MDMPGFRLEDDIDLSIEALRLDVVEQRSAGQVIFVVKKITPDGTLDDTEAILRIVDSFVSETGCVPLKEWLWLDIMEAVWVLTRVLWGDLCYNTSIMSRDEALALAGRFTSLFGQDTKFLTNRCRWRKRVVPLPDPIDYLDGWVPITQATCDTGVIVVSPQRVGMLWVQDED